MTRLSTPLRRAAGVLAALACLAAAGCMLLPGRFTSSLDLRRDGSFTFAYAGEMHVLALSKLAQMGDTAATFTPSPCHDAEMAVRECTARELAEQKSVWEETRKSAADRRKREADQMKTMFGGLDLSDPRAAGELTQRLRKQAGWRRVDYRGDGLFDVDFRLTGRLDHDFQFPTIERFPNLGGFLTIAVRNDRTLRVDAPGFGAAMGGEPFGAMMGMAALRSSGDGAGKPAGMPEIDGTFTITTDGDILANNTDDAPQPDAAGKRLNWTVNGRTTAAPMAIVRLAR